MVRAPIVLRCHGTQDTDLPESAITANISLGGAYFERSGRSGYTANETVVVSISIPKAEKAKFPFSRLAGRSRVVRIDALPNEEGSEPRYGVALQFGEHLLALSSIQDS